MHVKFLSVKHKLAFIVTLSMLRRWWPRLGVLMACRQADRGDPRLAGRDVRRHYRGEELLEPAAGSPVYQSDYVTQVDGSINYDEPGAGAPIQCPMGVDWMAVVPPANTRTYRTISPCPPRPPWVRIGTCVMIGTVPTGTSESSAGAPERIELASPRASAPACKWSRAWALSPRPRRSSKRPKCRCRRHQRKRCSSISAIPVRSALAR